jgi:hypothetical protein
MAYPKWVKRAPDIGAVLVLNAADEQALLDDWAGVTDAQLTADQAAATQAAAALAKANAQLVSDQAKKRR